MYLFFEMYVSLHLDLCTYIAVLASFFMYLQFDNGSLKNSCFPASLSTVTIVSKMCKTVMDYKISVMFQS